MRSQRVFDEPYTHLDIDTMTNLLYKKCNLLNITYHMQIRFLRYRNIRNIINIMLSNA